MKDRRSSVLFYFAAIAAISWLIPQTAMGHNGSVVVASVVHDITVDGDLSDWPDDTPWHSMDLNLYGDPEDGPSDCTARFRVGVDPVELKVYVAFKIRDQSYVPQPNGHRTWKSNDGTHVYLGAPSFADVSYSTQVDRIPVHFDKVHLYDEENQTWTGESTFDLREANFEDLETPFSAAFSIGCNDRDADGSFSVKYWSPGISKDINPYRRGDLIVCGESRGRIRGVVRRGSGGDDVGKMLLHFEAVDNPMLQIDLLSNADGSYELELPPGKYRRAGIHLNSKVLDVHTGQITEDIIGYPTLPLRNLRLADFASPAEAIPGFAPTLRRGPFAKQYAMDKLNGLPDRRILALEQDSAGALWIGTLANLATYDGETLRVYDSEFTQETHGFWRDDRLDRLWVASRVNVGFITDGTFNSFPLLDRRDATCVGPTHDGRVCIGTRTGLFLWNEQRFEYHSTKNGLPDELVTSLARDEQRNVTWIGTNMGLAAFDGVDYEIFDQRHGLADPRIVSLFVDSRDRLWVGTANSLYYYANDRFHLVRKHPTERERYVRSFVELENGDIEVGAFNESITIKNAFPDVAPDVRPESRPSDAMLFDRDMQFWRGSEDGELRRVDRGLQHIYRAGKGRCEFVYSIGEELWFVQLNNGDWKAVRLNKKNLAATEFPLNAESNQKIAVSNFLATANGIWVGTRKHGVFQLVNEEWLHLDLPTQTFSEVTSINEDSQKRIWITTLRKLFRCKNGKITELQIPGCPYTADLLHVVESPEGHFAIGTTQGIFVVDDQMQLVDRHHESNGLLSNVSRAISFGEDGTMWVATFNGLQTIKGREYRKYTSSDGMLDNKPKSFISMWDDEVWCASDAGINRISAKHNVVQHLLGNGALGNNRILSAVPDGDAMWLGGDSGIWKYRRGKFAPRLFVDDVATTESIGPQDSVSVTTDLKKLTVKFHANSLKNRRGGMIYQYQLQGLDDDWTSARENEIAIDVPRSGSYELRLRAIDRDLLASSPEVVALRVRPPYARWASNLALIFASAASLVLGLLYFAHVREEKSALEKSVEKQTAKLSDLERELQHAQKMKALGTLASGVAHDFNNSLMAINGNAELALLSDSVKEKNELVLELLSVTEQMAGLTKSMLMFGGRTSSSKKSVDIRVAVSDVETILRRTLPASIEFRCDVPNEPVYCEADLSQIHQVILNLALNARDAMPDGGQLMVGLERDGDTAKLTVQDNGHGMSEETQERIFEPFYTEKPRGKGTGLGLSVVHAIVRDHNGNMIVNSSLGEGSVFLITLSTQRVGSPTTAPETETPANSHGKVLLADDELQVRTTLAKGLVQAGFDVETAEDGFALMKQFRKSKYDVVIVDVDMPGKSGWDCLGELRAVEKDLAAIVISGLPNQEDRFDQNTLFIRKPFSLRDLTEKISTSIHRKQSDSLN